MLEKESIMVVQCRLKILSLGKTVQHHSANRMILNRYPCDNFQSHLRNYNCPGPGSHRSVMVVGLHDVLSISHYQIQI